MELKRKTLCKRDVERITEECCLNEELSGILLQLAKGKSIVQIAFAMDLSPASVNRRIAEIRQRMTRI